MSTIRMVPTTGASRAARHETPQRPAEPLSTGLPRATISFVSGLEAGRIVRIEGSSLLIGRGVDVDLQVEDAAVSRAHARIVRSQGGAFHIEDLGSTNGTFVGSRRVTVAPLGNGDHVQLGPRALLRFALTDPTDERVQAGLYESATRDPLTSAYNRRYLLSRLEIEVAYARRHGAPLAALMFDIDHFKQFNDRHGHFVGDRILCLVSAQAMHLVRAGDLVARFGGDEFVVLARETNLDDAIALAERIRRAVTGMNMVAGGAHVQASISIGAAALSEIGPDEPASALLERVDSRLGTAKRAGRNRVCAADR